MSIYYRMFFECKTCGFKLTKLSQVNRSIEGYCPGCGDNNLDYMTKPKRKEYARDLMEELSFMLEDDDTNG